MALPEDIITKVRQDFCEDDSLRVFQIFSELRKENPDLFSDRILRCIIILAHGLIEELAKAVTLARDDWQALIMAAEYHWGNCVRLLSLPFGIYPDIEIFKHWLVGQQIVVPWGVGCDEKWTIEYSEIRGLPLEQVYQLKNASWKVLDPNLYFAKLSFLCIYGSKEISATKAIEGKISIYYRLRPETGEFEFKKFSYHPQDLGKRGKW